MYTGQDSWHVHLRFDFLSDGDKALVVLCFVNSTISRHIPVSHIEGFYGPVSLKCSLINPPRDKQHNMFEKLCKYETERAQQRFSVPATTLETCLQKV